MPEVFVLLLLVVPMWMGLKARDFKNLAIHSLMISLIVGTIVLMHPILINTLPFHGQFAFQFVGVILLLTVLGMPVYGLRVLFRKVRG